MKIDISGARILLIHFDFGKGKRMVVGGGSAGPVVPFVAANYAPASLPGAVSHRHASFRPLDARPEETGAAGDEGIQGIARFFDTFREVTICCRIWLTVFERSTYKAAACRSEPEPVPKGCVHAGRATRRMICAVALLACCVGVAPVAAVSRLT